MKRVLLVLIGLLALPHTLRAQEANAFRGGWVTQQNGHNVIYMLIARGDALSGTYCTDCADPHNLAFVINGHVASGVAHFTIRHDEGHGTVTLDDVQGTLHDKDLVLTLQRRRSSGAATTVTLHRPAPAPNVFAVTNDEAETTGNGGRNRPPYVLPGPLEQIRTDRLPGVWMWGTGPGKQYFMIQQVGTQLLGMVCGPCENPNNMAPLDGFVIDGTALTFNIVHEDTGAAVEHGPFNNVAHGTMSRNELHIKVVPSYEPPDAKPFEMTLLGPVIFQ
jgi:hypothetical protein